ncbi:MULTISPECIES: sigma-54-dependent Fis family transcriptional regulator [unclassified Sedimentibacter]|uniref:sigma-54-dependent Fis family transcriptional regulator n=1 Tax=unclassified Sedimentibacter TaxID=2649220 RepID=UPI0027E16D05|nr:sigma-54-dependent Fis family transcriptional regulator [Sedimentibacter sp. MB35-C1]WMJ78167.1 sigma 54-interacting transcriptional regulator [Sedimentibacter sp. MB35-C1]
MFLNMNVKFKVMDIMDTNIIKVPPSKTVADIIEEFAEKDCGEAFVIETDSDGAENIQGMLTMSGIYKLIKENKSLRTPVSAAMNSSVLTVSPELHVEDAQKFMLKEKAKSAAVCNHGKIVGIIENHAIEYGCYKSIIEMRNELIEIIDHLHEGVCVVDKYGVVGLWNKSAEKLYNVSSDEIMGKKLKDFFPTALLNIVLERKKAIENVYHSPRENSVVAISAKPIMTNNCIIGAVSSETDITERANLTIKLEEAKERVSFLETEYKKLTEDCCQMGSIIGRSKKITEVIVLAKQLSKTDVNVLITGESGTGKEVFARAIHTESGRKGDFVAINCGAVPENLLESELFGYEGGAFTGALSKGKKGKFFLADKGTLFLDEIGEMPLDMQVKLLRVLQDGEIHPLGGEKPIKVDARIIAATNQNLQKMMNNGEFREDLYYRLNVVTLYLPPLRERSMDIPLFINEFLKEFSERHHKEVRSISPQILKILLDYEWKGNIRELKNTIERLVVLSDDKSINIEALPEDILKNVNEKSINELDQYNLQKVLENTEKKIITQVMKLNENNKKKAAEMLNIPRSTLYYKLKQYTIE